MKKIPYLLSLMPIIFLIGLLSFNVYIYGDNAISGANQIALIISGSIAAIIGIKYGVGWKVIIGGISNNIKRRTWNFWFNN